jgi:hypothetical protein
MSEQPQDQDAQRPRTKKCPVTVTAMVLIFISGGIVGAGLTILLQPEEESFMSRRRTPEEQGEFLADHYDEMLDFDKDQKEKAAAVLRDWVIEWRKISEVIKPQKSVIMEDMNRNMAAILTDEQKKIWEDHFKERFAHLTAPAKPETQPAGGQ